MSHPKFDGHLKQFLPSRDLQVVMATIKQKVSAWQETHLLYASAKIANMRLSTFKLSLSLSSFAASFCFWKCCFLACLSADSEGISVIRNKVVVN